MTDERRIIGARIAAARRSAGFSQVELGHLIGVSGQTISNWETSRYLPSASDVVSLVRSLGCSSDYILGLSDKLSPRD
ncbi:MAG: helix-turn-helix transcriptional regulator [Olsenella sp.]|nr:helix-turn-helix transcriptional regulator [Olsenella sp.]